MKTYFIDKIGNQQVRLTATSIAELESIAIRHAERNGGYLANIYVHCSQVVASYGGKCECFVEYIVRVNNQKRTITTKRV